MSSVFLLSSHLHRLLSSPSLSLLSFLLITLFPVESLYVPAFSRVIKNTMFFRFQLYSLLAVSKTLGSIGALQIHLDSKADTYYLPCMYWTVKCE